MDQNLRIIWFVDSNQWNLLFLTVRVILHQIFYISNFYSSEKHQKMVNFVQIFVMKNPKILSKSGLTIERVRYVNFQYKSIKLGKMCWLGLKKRLNSPVSMVNETKNVSYFRGVSIINRQMDSCPCWALWCVKECSTAWRLNEF